MKSKKLFKDNKRKSCIQCDFSVELSVAKYKKLKRWLHLYRGFKITKETILKILEENISYKGKYEYEANKIKTVIKDKLDEYSLPNNKIDVAELRNDWFPTDQYDILYHTLIVI